MQIHKNKHEIQPPLDKTIFNSYLTSNTFYEKILKGKKSKQGYLYNIQYIKVVFSNYRYY